MTDGQITNGAPTPEVVTDELNLIQRCVPLKGARVLDIGCGSGTLAQSLVERGRAAEALGIDLPEAVATLTEQPGVSFRAGVAEDLPVPDASVDVVLMLKSLHHVPANALDEALQEVARVLVPGGTLYVSEPVADGPFDEIVRNFHDEAVVRANAQAALARCTALELVQTFIFLAPVKFRDFDDFESRMMHMPTLWRPVTAEMAAATEAAYARLADEHGAFTANRENRVAVLRKPGGAKTT